MHVFMPKWVRRFFALALLSGCVATGHGEDIQLWGSSIEEWFEDLVPVTMTPPIAYDAFQQMGTNALPFLTGVLERKPSILAKAADEVREKYPPGRKSLGILGSAMEISERRMCAARLIGELGTSATNAIPTLMKVWDDPRDDLGVKGTVAETLAMMGDQVAPYLPDFLDAAKSTNGYVCEVGITLIGHCGPKGRTAVPLLLDFVRHGKPSLAGKAAEALWEVDHQTNVALQVFSRLLTNSRTQWLGIKYLSEMGEAARPVIPVLMSHLADTNGDERMGVEALIRTIDPEALAPINGRFRSETATNIANIIADLKSANAATRHGALMAVKM